MGKVDWPRRILTVVVGIPTALKLLTSDVGMWCLATTLGIFCVIEYATNIAPRIAPKPAVGNMRHVSFLVLVTVAVCAAAWRGGKPVHDAAIAAASLALSVYHLPSITKVDLAAISPLLLDQFALAFIVSGFAHAILLRSTTVYGLGFQVLGLTCAWVCDTGALVVGNLFGTTKLAPTLSPGKTIVGAGAGVVSAVATVVCLFHLPQIATLMPWVDGEACVGFLPPVAGIGLAEQVILGIVLGVLCILGDLVESLLKRVADVKDSGVFFPGHGGCLDRMDSVLFVAQALYFYSSFRVANSN